MKENLSTSFQGMHKWIKEQSSKLKLFTFFACCRTYETLSANRNNAETYSELSIRNPGDNERRQNTSMLINPFRHNFSKLYICCIIHRKNLSVRKSFWVSLVWLVDAKDLCCFTMVWHSRISSQFKRTQMKIICK